MLPFSLCNKKILAIRDMNRPIFPTTLSISFCDIGKYVGLRTYQHPIVKGPFLSCSAALVTRAAVRFTSCIGTHERTVFDTVWKFLISPPPAEKVVVFKVIWKVDEATRTCGPLQLVACLAMVVLEVAWCS